MYRSKDEVLEHFNLKSIPPTELSKEPINPRTGKEYTKNSWAWWLWWYGLSEEDAGIYADWEALEY